ncbi:MAG: type III restriction-modification system endonuclease [Formosimonas sp.]
MAGFHFERDLPHQKAAVDGVMQALDCVGYAPATDATRNPVVNFAQGLIRFKDNLRALHAEQGINEPIVARDPKDIILDVSMETGTGKTYAYTKTIFELNRQLGLFKFIIAVPRVAIKAGAVSFLKSDAAREHFKLDYDKEIKVYEVAAVKKSKSKKDFMPASVMAFFKADARAQRDKIHVLVINSGMINSSTMSKKFDQFLADEHNVPFEAIAATAPVLVIDEPHLFKENNKTFENLKKFQPQFTVRYGATFDGEYRNLVYQLDAVAAFNQDLVKGIVAHVQTFKDAHNARLKLVDLDGVQATFELTENEKQQRFTLGKNQSFEAIHAQMAGLFITKDLNKSRVVLSNGLELRKGDTLNPYSYSESLQNHMITQTIARHFELERELLLQTPRIKPLTLFFIDNIASYRDADGAMRTFFEGALKAHISGLIQAETDATYKAHLKAALLDVGKLHGGYFSLDNSSSDDAIERETQEILHDKEALLSLANPRRFIFSKWTLREGWDNPNIFQICKLRSSGSETSKLQEVGRGLRLPVNEYMNRDKSRSYDLHYHVDFTEEQFIQKLTQEINDKSGVAFDEVKLNEAMIRAILSTYPQFDNDEEQLLEALDDAGIINRKNEFKAGGFAKLKAAYTTAFVSTGIKSGKVKNANDARPKTSIRSGKYHELKALWESINQKVVLEYKFNESNQFKDLFKAYLLAHQRGFIQAGSMTQQQRLIVAKNQVSYRVEDSIEGEILPFKMMAYKDFVRTLSKELSVSINQLHEVFREVLASGDLDINPYMSLSTIRTIKKGFNDYLMSRVFGTFKISYKKVSKAVHPTWFTDKQGQVKTEIFSSEVGRYSQAGQAPEGYLFDEIFYDSELELKNIKNPPAEVIVYSKIPKSSIRIPLVGGGTYSPDFAYVVKKDGRSELNFVIETKDKSEIDLSANEKQRIEHAKHLFKGLGDLFKVQFVTQMSHQKMVDLLKQEPVKKSV